MVGDVGRGIESGFKALVGCIIALVALLAIAIGIIIYLVVT